LYQRNAARGRGMIHLPIDHFAPMHQGNPIPLSLEEHQELGTELRNTRARLHQLCDLVAAVYGPNNQAAFTFVKAVEALDRLSLDMQAQANQDLPGVRAETLYH
jgi:hypothetical protein